MFVKICANTTLADAQLAIDAGADAVGFVFAPSKRQVTPEQVADITAGLSGRVEKVGVFSTSDAREVARIVKHCRLTAAQLHGAFSSAAVRDLHEEFGDKLKIIQTVAYELSPEDPEAADRRFTETLRGVLGEPGVWAVLLDAAKKGSSGGLGVSFDWVRMHALLAAAWPERQSVAVPRLLLAGGLRPENVGEAIRTLRPSGVDVASGVERSPGEKDPQRVRDFVMAARADRMSS